MTWPLKEKAPCGAGIIGIVLQIRVVLVQPGVWAEAVALVVAVAVSSIFLIPSWVPLAVAEVPEVPEVPVECPLFPSRAEPGVAEADRILFSYPAHWPWKQ